MTTARAFSCTLPTHTTGIPYYSLITKDLTEANANVTKRLDYIKGEMGRVDSQIKSLQERAALRQQEVGTATLATRCLAYIMFVTARLLCVTGHAVLLQLFACTGFCGHVRVNTFMHAAGCLRMQSAFHIWVLQSIIVASL